MKIQQRKNIGKLRFLFIVSTISFLLLSCSNKAIFDQSYSFKNDVWTKKDTVQFNINVNDTLSYFDFVLSLRNSTSYMYSNLWIYVLVTAPDGTTSKVAEQLPIANPDGSWIGRVSGSLVENRLRFASKTFPLKGKYTFKLVNATAQGDISNVEDIGLRIQKVVGKK